ncbi:hypothetical protein N0V93_003140 [Gnomoniopsis smithogilvyi]|uniref:Uncharacterized protein n=1 Tax=Gnomoniopsis smithogilvyi TaxID=1191159 RepID=A0A9W8YXZ9_9PEZI|nr:hypothetical protein N0V93_003140 [Gnomoniopsis smithogilvyi]
MRERHEVKAPSTIVSGTQGRSGNCNCEEEQDDDDNINAGRWACDCVRSGDGLLLMRDGGMAEREEVISLAPSLVITIEDPISTSSLSREATTSTLSTRYSSSGTSSSSAESPPTSTQSIASTSGASATTILTITLQTTHSLSPRTSSFTRTFTPTGYQSIVPTYPPLTSSSTSTTNQSSLGTRLSLGLGIPIAVLLILLLTIVLHRRQVRLAKDRRHHHHRHRNPTSPEMATISTIEPTYPHLHPVPSSRFSTAGDVVVTPAPGISTPTPGLSAPMQLYFPPPPSPPPPAVPRRSSARLLAGPLTSHPPARPPSSIYDGDDATRESAVALGGNGVGNVLADYLMDPNPQHVDGPWNSDQVHVPALLLPPKPVARNRPQDQRRQYLSVDTDHSPGGIEEVSPLSSSSSGPQYPARSSVMSGLSPSSPVRTHSRRRV